jgi:hypothetical protein
VSVISSGYSQSTKKILYQLGDHVFHMLRMMDIFNTDGVELMGEELKSNLRIKTQKANLHKFLNLHSFYLKSRSSMY